MKRLFLPGLLSLLLASHGIADTLLIRNDKALAVIVIPAAPNPIET